MIWVSEHPNLDYTDCSVLSYYCICAKCRKYIRSKIILKEMYRLQPLNLEGKLCFFLVKIFRQYAQRQKNGYTAIDSDMTVEYNLHYINRFVLASIQTILKTYRKAARRKSI